MKRRQRNPMSPREYAKEMLRDAGSVSKAIRQFKKIIESNQGELRDLSAQRERELRELQDRQKQCQQKLNRYKGLSDAELNRVRGLDSPQEEIDSAKFLLHMAQKSVDVTDELSEGYKREIRDAEEAMRVLSENPEQTKTKIPWIAVAAGLLGIIWLRNWKKVPLNKVPYGARVEYAMQPTQGKANQLASIQTYRLIANRRPSMTYTPVTEEKDDKTLIFTVPVDGTVTRNVLVDGDRKYVEIATA